jgi:hypothetical protein
MAHRLSQFQEFVLKFQSKWNLAGKTSEDWSQSFYVSGTINHNDADAETAALALAAPALALATTGTSLVGFAYYPSQSQVSTTNKTYTPGTHAGTQSAYSASPTLIQQLEVAAVAHAPIGKSTRGKTIYLRKYFHDVAASASDINALDGLTSASTLLGVFNNGAGPHAVVPVSPTSGKNGPWTMETHLFTHQLRKGKKRKQPAAGLIQQLVNAGMSTADAVALAAKLLLK